MRPSVDHNDLHPGNVLVGDPPPRIYDWGDAVLAHPFASMLLPLTVLRDGTLGTSAVATELDRLRDAYLEPFADLAPHAELVRTLELACRVAKIARALTWHRATGTATDPRGRWDAAPLACLASLPEPSHLGGA